MHMLRRLFMYYLHGRMRRFAALIREREGNPGASSLPLLLLATLRRRKDYTARRILRLLEQIKVEGGGTVHCQISSSPRSPTSPKFQIKGHHYCPFFKSAATYQIRKEKLDHQRVFQIRSEMTKFCSKSRGKWQWQDSI